MLLAVAQSQSDPGAQGESPGESCDESPGPDGKRGREKEKRKGMCNRRSITEEYRNRFYNSNPMKNVVTSNSRIIFEICSVNLISVWLP